MRTKFDTLTCMPTPSAHHTVFRVAPDSFEMEKIVAQLNRLKPLVSGEMHSDFWSIELLPYLATDARGIALISRITRRGLDLRLSGPLRASLLRYQDGMIDVVLTSHSKCIGRAGLQVIAAFLLADDGATLPRGVALADQATRRDTYAEIAPDWGGLPFVQGEVTLARATSALPELSVNTIALVAAAIAIAISRRTNASQITFRVEGVAGMDELVLPAVDNVRYVNLTIPLVPDVDEALEQLTKCWHDAMHVGPNRVADRSIDVVLQLPFGDTADAHLVYCRTIDDAPLRFAFGVDRDAQRLDCFSRSDLITSQAAKVLLDDVMDVMTPRSLASVARAAVQPFANTHLPNLHARVIAACDVWPEKDALCGPSGRLSYAEMMRRADAVTLQLSQRGCGRGTLVGVCMSRDIGFVVAMLGIMGAGAAYVPLDPEYPDERLRFSAEDAELAMVLVEKPSSLFNNFATLVVGPDGLLASVDGSTRPSASVATREDLAYVIYTSGSTGKPKGVMVEHGNILDLLDGTADRCGFGPCDTWTCFHSFSFDFSVWEVWACLASGGRLIIVAEDVARAPGEFLQLLAAERVTVLNQTPSAFAQITMSSDFARTDLGLRLVILGGEALQARLLLPWFDRYGEKRLEIANLYGITETTVHCTWKTIKRVHALRDDRSIGVALPGWITVVLDSAGRRCPPGVPGEIWVGGGGVARGYLGRPGLSATRFRPAPATGLEGQRMYRSGDKGRLKFDGEIEYLGRLDQQVKVRGYRIELGEIRARLLELPDVQDAAVVVARRGAFSDAFIDAYVVGPKALIAELRRRLVECLPAYMVPATLTRVDTLPLTINGKLDQRRLSPDLTLASEGIGSVGGPVIAEGNALESKVSEIWRHVLGVDVGLDDNFFLVGGNSLLAIRVTRRMQDEGIANTTARRVYANPTVRSLCAALQGEAAKTIPSALITNLT